MRVCAHRNTQFQSSPDSKVGCNIHRLSPYYDTIVSILTRLEGRVQLALEKARTLLGEVSILTRLEGRVQPQGQM